MSDKRTHICPVEHAGSLDLKIRRWVQNPHKILSPYIEEGMTVMDFGCGPGFFTIDMAKLAGRSGRVMAVDLQRGMLEKLKKKISGTEFEERITLHLCETDKIGLTELFDFILAFYMIHELPDPGGFFKEVVSLLTAKGRLLIVEPPFHVSKSAFEEMIRSARNAGLFPVERPKVAFSKSVLLKKE